MLLLKEQTWTIPEYVKYLEGKKQKEITKKEARQIENKLGQLIKNPTVKKAMVTTAALMLHSIEVAADTANAVSKIDAAGSMILLISRKALYWLAIIMCGVEIGKCLLNGDTAQIGRIVGKYIAAFAVLYFLPWAFDLIAGIFS